jgi:hypothetical protein
MFTSVKWALIRPLAAFVTVAPSAEALSRKSRVALFVMLAAPADEKPAHNKYPSFVILAFPAVAVPHMLMVF